MNKAKLISLWKELVKFDKIIMLIILAMMAYLIARSGIKMGLAFIAITIGVLYIINLIRNPYIGLMTIYVYNYIVMGLTRYFPLPLGLSVDALFVLTYISLFFNSFFKEVEWHRAKKTLTLLAFIWLLYGILELFNPAAHSREAWFYAIRGFSLYFFLTIPLTFILFHRYRDLKRFLNIWAFLTLFAAIKGIIQYTVGLDFYETIWLNEIGNITHNLITGLRIFSIFTDAGHFGASMGMSMIVFGILGVFDKNILYKIFYLTVMCFSCYGMLISGTRGAIAVPVAGLMLFILLSKQVKLMICGLAILCGTFVFFKYTTIGEGNYTIRRMRTAFDPKEASLQTRLRNQKKLSIYMADRPFGWGIGSSGDWAKRFSPNSILATIPTDSWFVSIWVEQGIVGLILHLAILFYVLLKGSYIVVFQIKNRELNLKIKALLAGFFGMLVASYGNGLLGQFPTGIICYMIEAFVIMSLEMDKTLIQPEATKTIPDNNTHLIENN